MRRTVFSVALALCLLWAGTCAAGEIGWMTPEQLKEELGRVTVLDVRPGMSRLFSLSKITGSVREEPGKEDEWANKYPNDRPLVLYCQTDVTSSGVARKLSALGFEKIFILRGGWSAWSGAGFPTEKK